MYGVLELATGGELFEVLSQSGPFNENLTRYFALQLFSAMKFMHSKKIAHRDLKPENLLFDRNFNLKIADFGVSVQTCEGQKNETYAGTTQFYMAPEIFFRKKYEAVKTDVFSCGVILFMLMTCKAPFKYSAPFPIRIPQVNATSQSQQYVSKYSIFVKNKNAFWDLFQSYSLSEDFKELLNGMLRLLPHKRLDVTKILESEWMTKYIDKNRAMKDMRKLIQKCQRNLDFIEESQNDGKRILSEETQIISQKKDSYTNKDLNTNDKDNRNMRNILSRRSEFDSDDKFGSDIMSKKKKGMDHKRFDERMSLDQEADIDDDNYMMNYKSDEFKFEILDRKTELKKPIQTTKSTFQKIKDYFSGENEPKTMMKKKTDYTQE